VLKAGTPTLAVTDAIARVAKADPALYDRWLAERRTLVAGSVTLAKARKPEEED
jgi:hypothetical protein